MADTNEIMKTQRGRSRSYPVIALGDALEKIKSINTNLGVNGQFNRESIAAGMGYSSLNGTSGRRIAALVQYGFLDRERDLYYLSASAKRYLLPVNDNDQQDVIKDAALLPDLFSDIYNTFKGQVLPKQFVNRLIQEFGIEQKAASDVERVFKSTMETAGALQANGILKSEAITDSKVVSEDQDEDPDTKKKQADSGKINKPVGYLSVELPSGLTISYSQALASAFAFGVFGQELKALDDAVTAHNTQSAVQTEDVQ